MSRQFHLGSFSSETFSHLAKAEISESRWFFENKSRGIFELGIGKIRGNAPRNFLSKSFDSSENFFFSPKWQISMKSGRTVVFRNFSEDENLLSEKEIREEFSALLKAKISDKKVPKISMPNEIGGNWYLPAAKKIIAEIEAQKFQKLVLARSLELAANSEIPIAPIIEKLRERFSENCTIFSISENGENFMGASPETLAHVKNGILETEALAGSIPNFKNVPEGELAEKLLADKKERREHAFVVEFISKKLEALGMKAEFSDVPEVVILPNILHLRTSIKSVVPADLKILEIVKKLHPTPAMCGVPTEIAREKILKTEPFPRGKFAGPLGFFDENGDGFFAVGIRCAKIQKNKIQLYAGSGLVSGSVPEKEFSEIDSKFSAVLDHIQS